METQGFFGDKKKKGGNFFTSENTEAGKKPEAGNNPFLPANSVSTNPFIGGSKSLGGGIGGMFGQQTGLTGTGGGGIFGNGSNPAPISNPNRTTGQAPQGLFGSSVINEGLFGNSVITGGLFGLNSPGGLFGSTN